MESRLAPEITRHDILARFRWRRPTRPRFRSAPPLPGERPMSTAAVSYARQNHARFLAELKDLLRIPSVSTLPQHKDDVQRAAQFVADQMRRIGMENVEVIKTAGHPLVYGDWLHAAGKPTVLC